MKTAMMKALNNDEWAVRGAVAVKAGTLLSVISFIAIIGAHVPTHDEITATATTETTPAAEATYYFPSQYELNAAEPGEAAPTF